MFIFLDEYDSEDLDEEELKELEVVDIKKSFRISLKAPIAPIVIQLMFVIN